MSDLISRSALIDVLRNWADRNAERGYDTAYDMVQECIEVVKERPIAYNVDKVVEQLEESSYWTQPHFDEDGFKDDDTEEVINLTKATEIVKAGGVE